MNSLQYKLIQLQTRYSVKEIAQITEISTSYLYQIRQGKKINVSRIYANSIINLYNKTFRKVELTRRHKKEKIDYRVIMLILLYVILLVIIIS